MTIVIKRTDSKTEVAKKLSRVALAAKRKKIPEGFNANKFLGKIKGLFGNPLEYQKRLRDEWQ